MRRYLTAAVYYGVWHVSSIVNVLNAFPNRYLMSLRWEYYRSARQRYRR